MTKSVFGFFYQCATTMYNFCFAKNGFFWGMDGPKIGCINNKLIQFFCYGELKDRALLYKNYIDTRTNIRWEEIFKNRRK